MTAAEWKHPYSREAAAFPAPPTDADISFTGQADLRPRFVLIALGAIAALGSCLLLVGSSSARGDEPAAPAEDQFEEVDPFALEDASQESEDPHSHERTETIEA